MFNGFIYGYFTTKKLQSLRFFEYLEIAKEYGKIHNASDAFSPDGHLLLDYSTEPVFVSINDEDNTDIIFYQNLFFLMSYNDETKDRIVQIYIKRPDDDWEIPRKPDGSLDFLNPSNVKVEVYVKYDVSVIKFNRRLSRCNGEYYRYGVWNKMFYKSMKSFTRTVENYTEINQIKLAYNK